MKNLWSDLDSKAAGTDKLALRVYTSRLLGAEESLVLHGGGNTSVKDEDTNIFGEKEAVLRIKGSGRDLRTIDRGGFSSVRLEPLLKMARLSELSDPELVKIQRGALLDPSDPDPSVEAILHALIPFQYVDHTHSDAVIALTNAPDPEERLARIYGRERILVLPYAMPGFKLARQVYLATRDIDWRSIEAIVLLHHGVFTFGDDARTAYTRMIDFVTRAEDALEAAGALALKVRAQPPAEDLREIAAYRREVSRRAGRAMVGRLAAGPEAVAFSSRPDLDSVATRGPLTSDHVTYAKAVPLAARAGEDPRSAVARYAEGYAKYFAARARPGLVMHDPAPRWVVLPDKGWLSFGSTRKKCEIVHDVARHTARAIQWSEALGGWRPISEDDAFHVEYWDLLQAKLKLHPDSLPLQGKVALVTGGASGIGKACAEELQAQGAVVTVLDLNPKTPEIFAGPDFLPLVCDVTDVAALRSAVEETVRRFGGLDILVTNAGSFPPGKNISEIEPEAWRKAIEINLSSHQYLMKLAIPFLEQGVDPSIVVIASKNVPAPGPGASAYSASKAALTQLARVAALELGPKGVRVNVIHPNAVFDTGIWTPEVLANRAKHYGMSVEEYKTNNVLRVEVTSRDVGRLACAMAGPIFAKTTGSQVPIDGGNDRVI